MAELQITIEDHTPELMNALENAINRGLKAVGLTAEKYAKDMCPRSSDNNKSHLQDHIRSEVDEHTMYVGVTVMPVPYGIYVHEGTGIYATHGGRPTPWVYRDANGNFWRTRGIKPNPFIRKAVEDHVEEYLDMLADSINNY